jgi:hypothetical protein
MSREQEASTALADQALMSIGSASVRWLALNVGQNDGILRDTYLRHLFVSL